MNIGTICYATQSGLGHLAKQFYDAGVINRILLNPHPRYQSFPEWYRKEDLYQRQDFLRFLDKLDVVVIFENAFSQWRVVELAKRRGCKFILIPMYEWTPNPLPVKPDLILCPSLLDVEYFPQYPCQFLNIPVTLGEHAITWRERNIALRFVHNAGHGQVGYAKGTPEVLEAFNKHVKSDAILLVRGQKNEPRIHGLLSQYYNHKKITVVYDDIPYNQLFSTGDVYINAERYNGLSLPLQEAYASGMMVTTTNRFPANTWLPIDPLIPVKKYDRHSVNHTTFDRAEIDPIDIAKCVDSWYGKDITTYSQMGKRWGEEHSWERMKPIYLECFEQLVRGTNA